MYITLLDVARCVPECNPDDILLLSVSKLTTVFVYNMMCNYVNFCLKELLYVSLFSMLLCSCILA